MDEETREKILIRAALSEFADARGRVVETLEKLNAIEDQLTPEQLRKKQALERIVPEIDRAVSHLRREPQD